MILPLVDPFISAARFFLCCFCVCIAYLLACAVSALIDWLRSR